MSHTTPLRARRIRPLAVLTAAAIAAGGLTLAVSAPASAAPTAISAGTGVSTWGVVDRWDQYVNQFGGSFTPVFTTGSTPGALGGSYPAGAGLELATTTGTYDPSTGTISAKLQDITYRVPAHGIELSLTDIKVAINGTSHTGTLTADISGNAATVPGGFVDNYAFASLDATSATLTGTGSQLVLSGIAGTVSSTIGDLITSWDTYEGVAMSSLELEFGTQSTVAVAVTPAAVSGTPKSDDTTESIAVTVDAPAVSDDPTGTVDIYDNRAGSTNATSTLIARDVPLVAGVATATTQLPAGGHTFTAVYKPTAASAFASAAATTTAWYGVYAPTTSSVTAPAVGSASSDGFTASWLISGYANATSGAGAWSRSARDGITVDTTSKAFVLSEGVATYSDTAFELAFAGTMHVEPNSGYWFELTDPTLVLDADGNGAWTADMTVKEPSLATPTDPVPVVFATVTGATVPVVGAGATSGSIALDYAHAVSFGTWNLGYDSSWTNSFVVRVPSAIRAYFYQSSTSAANLTKPPVDFLLDWTEATSTTLSAPATVDAGALVPLSADVTGAPDGATVEFREGSTVLASATVEDGVASASVAFLPGTHDVRAFYLGDDTTAASSSAVSTVAADLVASQTTLSASTTAPLPGQTVALSAAVSTGTGTVRFLDGATEIATAAVSSGVASVSVALGEGSHALTAEYAGDEITSGSTSAVVTVTVAKSTSSIALAVPASVTYGTSSTLVASVAPAATGTVTFREGAKVLGTVVISGTTASLKVGLAIGAHAIVATYSGSETAQAATSAAVSAKVTKLVSKTTVAKKTFAKSSKPTVTVKVAKLANGKYATGTVRVYVNGKSVKTVTLKASAKGVVKVALPKKYSTSITVSAKFGGNSIAASSTSAKAKFTAK